MKPETDVGAIQWWRRLHARFVHEMLRIGYTDVGADRPNAWTFAQDTRTIRVDMFRATDNASGLRPLLNRFDDTLDRADYQTFYSNVLETAATAPRAATAEIAP